MAREGGNGSVLRKIVVYDNAPEAQCMDLNIEGLDYVADARNGGVAQAYNYALKVAKAAGCAWLLLLDQDSQIEEDIFVLTAKALRECERDERIVAIVPHMMDGTTPVSPSRIHLGDVHRPVGREVRGVCEFEVTALGSGTVVNVAFLETIRGFDERYWLDCADRKMFYEIWRSGRRVLVSDVVLRHELSINDYDNRVSESRYENILAYEWMFQRECKKPLDHIVFAVRLLYRTGKLLIVAKNKRHACMTLKECVLVFCWLLGFEKTKHESGGRGTAAGALDKRT